MMRGAFYSVKARIESMVDLNDLAVPGEATARQLLAMSNNILRDDVRLPVNADEEWSTDDLSPEVVRHACQGLTNAEKNLVWVRDHLYGAESYLVFQERMMTEGGSGGLLLPATRFERAKYRYALKDVVANLQTERLRQVFAVPINPSEPQASPAQWPIEDDQEEPCPICYEANGSPVSTLCCKKFFHIDCLLEWVFGKISQQNLTTCPMCRTKLSQEFLGEMLEMKVRDMECL